MNVINAIQSIRNGVCAIVRVESLGKPGSYKATIVGTAWCVSQHGHFITAYHVLNDGKGRKVEDRFYVIRAPNNGGILNYWAVDAFLVEDSVHDLVLLSAAAAAGPGVQPKVTPIPVTLTPPPDGSPLFTYGCPAPTINNWNCSPTGEIMGIQTTLFAHANTGIVSAQYPASAAVRETLFEFSVRFHHGESGGPVLRLEPDVAAFAVMQSYRVITAPHAKIDGPRRGFGLDTLRAALQGVDVVFV